MIRKSSSSLSKSRNSNRPTSSSSSSSSSEAKEEEKSSTHFQTHPRRQQQRSTKTATTPTTTTARPKGTQKKTTYPRSSLLSSPAVRIPTNLDTTANSIPTAADTASPTGSEGEDIPSLIKQDSWVVLSQSQQKQQQPPQEENDIEIMNESSNRTTLRQQRPSSSSSRRRGGGGEGGGEGGGRRSAGTGGTTGTERDEVSFDDHQPQPQPPSDLDTIHGLLSSIGKELNIAPSTTRASTSTQRKTNRKKSSGDNRNRDRNKDKSTSTSTIRSDRLQKGMSMAIPYNSILLLTNDIFSIATSTSTSTDAKSNISSSNSNSNSNNASTLQPTLQGRKLSLAHEHFIVLPVSPPSSSSSSSSSYLHYNDKIILFNTCNKALGINKKEQIGFWRSIIGEAEQWTIVPLFMKGGTDIDMNVDVDADANEDFDMVNGLVESGSNILLKNELNGKFLSISCDSDDNTNTNDNGNDCDPQLCVRGLVWNESDSNFMDDEDYDDDKVHNDNDDGYNEKSYQTTKRTMKRKTVQFTKNQIFNLVKINTPPCPKWIHTRPYLNGNYLSYHNRNRIDERDNLFTQQRQKQRRQRGNNIANIHNHNPDASTDQLWNLDVSIQDAMLVEELLDTLIGLEGSNIVVNSSSTNSNINNTNDHETTFVLRDKSKFDANIRFIVDKILPTASAYVCINSFISKRLVEYEYGTVSHALCGAMDMLVKEYLEFIDSLHDRYRQQDVTSSLSSSMTLSTLYGEMQPSIRTMSIIQRIVQEVKYSKGGALLNKIEDLLQMEYLGDERAKSIFCYLFERSSIPYMEMLSSWVEDGSLHDPYGEFMIEETRRDMTPLASAGIDALEEDSLSWRNWYVLREEHVLNVLLSNQSDLTNQDSTELAQKILTTGKYWNAISLCHHRDKRAVQLISCSPRGVESNRIQAPILKYGMVSVEMQRYVDHEYKMASRTFFNIVMRDYQTRDVLAFMKRYFLLDQGDFFVHFLDMAEDELLQEMVDVSRGRVQNWMAVSIQMSGGPGGGDYEQRSLIFDFVSSLKGEFATQSLINDLDELHAHDGGIQSHEPKTPSRHVYGGANKGLTGVEAFMLDFHKMPFPLSLILSRSTIRNYQLMFRHLFFAKHVERRLVGTWLDHQMIKEYTSLRKDMGKTYCLRQRMLHFMQNFVYYMMFEVIEPNFLQMESEILGRQTKEDEKYEFTSKKNDNVDKQHTVDDVLKIHNNFVRSTLKECLLTNRDLIRTLTKLMTTCLLFSDQMKLFMEATKIDEEQSNIATEARQKRTRHMYETAGILNERKEKKIREALTAISKQRKARKQKQIDMLRRELKTESYQNMISRFEQVFNSNLSEFMTQLMADSEGRYHSHLANLCVRLDYNGYVTRSMQSERK